MPLIFVPPTTLVFDDFYVPDWATREQAQRAFDLYSDEPVVVHEDEVFQNNMVVAAAIYLGIDRLPVMYLNSAYAEFEDAGSSNDA